MLKSFSQLFLVIIMIVGGTFTASANPQEIYTFATQAQQQQFEKITQELRCLVCQNETLADSTAGLAKDLRAEVYQQVKQGADEKTIKQYLVARYGQFILFKPAMNPLTLLLWILPFAFMVIAFIVLSVFAIKRKGNSEKIQLSVEDKQQLDKLLR